MAMILAQAKLAAEHLCELHKAEKARADALQAELAERLDAAFRHVACLIDDGPWWETVGGSEAVGIGERLVELGTWLPRIGNSGAFRKYKPKAAEAAGE